MCTQLPFKADSVQRTQKPKWNWKSTRKEHGNDFIVLDRLIILLHRKKIVIYVLGWKRNINKWTLHTKEWTVHLLRNARLLVAPMNRERFCLWLRFEFYKIMGFIKWNKIKIVACKYFICLFYALYIRYWKFITHTVSVRLGANSLTFLTFSVLNWFDFWYYFCFIWCYQPNQTRV